MPYRDAQERLLYGQRYREAHRQELRAAARQYEESHRDQKRASDRRYRAENREAVLEGMRRYYAAHRDRVIASVHNYRAAHIEEQRARGREWSRANRVHRRPYFKKWRDAHPSLVQAGRRRRRACKAGVLNTLTAREWADIQVAWGRRCAYCGRGDVKLTQDHMVPISKGGAHAVANVVPACLSCNSRKRDNTEWHTDWERIAGAQA